MTLKQYDQSLGSFIFIMYVLIIMYVLALLLNTNILIN